MLNWGVVFKQGLPVAGNEGIQAGDQEQPSQVALIWVHFKLGEPQDWTEENQNSPVFYFNCKSSKLIIF